MQTVWRSFLLLLPPSRTSTSCATGQHWSTWGALTTMQHNHSRRAASLVRPLRSVPSVPSQPPSTLLTPKTRPPSPQLPGGRRKGRACRPGDGLNQSQRSMPTYPTTWDFALKIITGTLRWLWQIWQLLYRSDSADRQLASLLRRSQTSLIVKGYW